MKNKSVIIIGSGPGGLSTAMLLASQGFDVNVYEKRSQVGGRTSSIQLGEFQFDRGPTFLSMPHILEELFTAANRNMDDYLDLIQVEPMYDLLFDDVRFTPSSDREQTKRKIDELFPGSSEGYVRFMEDTEKKMEKLLPLLQNRFDSIFDYARLRTFRALPYLSLGKTLYDVLGDYFDDERLKLSFTFQSKYLGMSPWECPGAFSILSYMEHKYGIFHPRGGLNQIPKALEKVTKEYGGQVHLNCGVDKLLVKNKKVVGVLLENGEQAFADEVIINADFAYAMERLLSRDDVKRFKKEKLERKEYSCSTFMIYLGMDSTFELPHHTVLFANDYKKNVEEIIDKKVLSLDPSIYVQYAQASDDTMAPAGKSTLYILAPVPNNYSLLDWEEKKEEFRNLVLSQVESKLTLSLRNHIEEELVITPMEWESSLHVYKGATFNLSHHLRQMMYFRPHNKFQDLDHCWLVGGGTHPGSGLPTIFESAKITSSMIINKYKVRRGIQ
ncbi:phytoene desaturase family protein [Alkalihalobacillus sp. LMS39]|uniref:phytoene desaturase family protein n=1 Tax=Alkalihalobacillus sp. LMS39 TaxID=2924032 RepID=UPI001FB523D0|nr:phytoene desaturase family protein [Alkalihalobacillus sp. LMS39]UOE96100.1 phytoene desaturase family protein [Alkalihalobacillus sp. LMS39]